MKSPPAITSGKATGNTTRRASRGGPGRGPSTPPRLREGSAPASCRTSSGSYEPLETLRGGPYANSQATRVTVTLCLGPPRHLRPKGLGGTFPDVMGAVAVHVLLESVRQGGQAAGLPKGLPARIGGRDGVSPSDRPPDPLPNPGHQASRPWCRRGVNEQRTSRRDQRPRKGPLICFSRVTEGT